jgi:hypothetical protein
MVAIRLVVITAIIVLVQVLGLCVAAPINPLPGASLNSWNGAASRVEKNEGTTLLMRRAPCFGNLCGKTDEERSSSLPSLPDPGRKERGDKFMAKVRGAIKGGWKGAGDVIGKAWDSAATGTRNALDFVTGGFDSGTVSRTPSRPKKAGQAKKAGQSNPAGPSLWTNPPTQRQNYGSLPLETHTQREHPASWPGSPSSGRSGDDSIASAPVGGKKEPKRPKGVKSASEWKGKADTGIKAKDKAEVNRSGNESPEKGRSIPKEGKCLTYPRSVD